MDVVRDGEDTGTQRNRDSDTEIETGHRDTKAETVMEKETRDRDKENRVSDRKRPRLENPRWKTQETERGGGEGGGRTEGDREHAIVGINADILMGMDTRTDVEWTRQHS